MDKNNSFLDKLLNKEVKVLYSDPGRNGTNVVVGYLTEIDPDRKYIVVNGVIIGLGDNFISCIPKNQTNLKEGYSG
ncbi:MAG TPA: hypothetical protein VMY59_05125 [Candidatus Thermoplasmatota archaeon]|nr:hypothetical protein [Candidatus Thermoplasmatota archaeon]